MKLYEKKLIPEKIIDEKVGLQCDLCGRKSPDNYDWTKDLYEVNETKLKVHVTVTQKKGEEYPEGGSGTEYEIDLCPECFKNRLVPWLKSEGAKIEEKGWYW